MNNMRTKSILHVVVGVLIAVCATTSMAQERFVFTPQWMAQAQFTGYYVAQEKGFYKEAGIEVDIVHPSATYSAMNALLHNESQATMLTLSQALDLMDKGTPLVNILQTAMNNGMVIVSARGQDPLTQKGARVGIWSAGFYQFALLMSEKEGLDYEWVRFASNVNLFVKGAIDATLAMSYNEYYQLKQAGMVFSEENVYRFSDHGYNVPEDGVYMTRAYYEKHKEQAKKFAQASRKGWEWAAEHPEEALDIVMRYVEANHIATNRVLQKLMLEEILRLQIDKQTGQRDFVLKPEMVQLASRLMLECNMIKKEITYEDIVGN